MTFLLAVFSVVLLASSARAGLLGPTKEELYNKQMTIQQECSLQYNVPETYLKLVLEGGATESRKGKCFMKCGLVGMGYIDGDGSLNEKNLRSIVYTYFDDKVQREFAIKSWKDCDKKCHSESYTDDSCDRAFNIAKCFVQQIQNDSSPITS
ncbi:uncharacterized protein [Halyomorpha halys]|uniref:uncharacterized protein isoform X2 n=1 Tax=Halyomorpha halys TaxID=286706 RepID=UPI0034D20A55